MLQKNCVAAMRLAKPCQIRAAVLQRLTLERVAIDDEEKRVEGRLAELKQRRTQAANDLRREEELVQDTDGVIATLQAEAVSLQGATNNDSGLRNGAAVALQEAAASLTRAQEAADEANNTLSALTAQRSAMERSIAEQQSRIAKLEREAADIAQRQLALQQRVGSVGDAATLSAAVAIAQTAAQDAEQAAGHAEVALRVSRQVEGDKRQSFDDARRKFDRLQTEVRTLTNLLKAGGGDLWPSLVDAIAVQPGYEGALAAALGEDIEASANEGAPVFWRGLPPLAEIAALPGNAVALAEFVQAPLALARILSHVGVVSKAVGAALQGQLKPGQRLVSVEGDVWRWDGFTAAADAPSAAAKRLAERNRLSSIEDDMKQAGLVAEAVKTEHETARAAVEQGVRAERDKREAWRASNSALEVARQALLAHERRMAETAAQATALEEAARGSAARLAEAAEAQHAAQAEFATLPAADGLLQHVNSLRDVLNSERATYAEARAKHDGLEREARIRAERLKAIALEQEQWNSRATKAKEQTGLLAKRMDETEAAIAELSQMPQQRSRTGPQSSGRCFGRS
jgi:chromosome segregation protein